MIFIRSMCVFQPLWWFLNLFITIRVLNFHIQISKSTPITCLELDLDVQEIAIFSCLILFQVLWHEEIIVKEELERIIDSI